MAVERFIWTAHAVGRCSQRLIEPSSVERVVAAQHSEREINVGDAEWLIRGLLGDGRRVEVVYDHPVGVDRGAVLIVSVWDAHEDQRRR